MRGWDGMEEWAKEGRRKRLEDEDEHSDTHSQ
jgi:hypothetical protein